MLHKTRSERGHELGLNLCFTGVETLRKIIRQDACSVEDALRQLAKRIRKGDLRPNIAARWVLEDAEARLTTHRQFLPDVIKFPGEMKPRPPINPDPYAPFEDDGWDDLFFIDYNNLLFPYEDVLRYWPGTQRIDSESTTNIPDPPEASAIGDTAGKVNGETRNTDDRPANLAKASEIKVGLLTADDLTIRKFLKEIYKEERERNHHPPNMTDVEPLLQRKLIAAGFGAKREDIRRILHEPEFPRRPPGNQRKP
jgi:hypothetical protein